MAAEKKKHLRELLEDDQEPFHLNHYIAELRSQISHSGSRVQKRHSENAAALPSPLFEHYSQAKKKTHHSRVFLHIPTRTAATLLEAAVRIQKQQSEKTNNRVRNRGNAFGIFGSVLKRLTNHPKAKPRLDNADASAVLPEPMSSSRRECFCESPFHFVLHATLSTSCNQTPHFTSTATSPAQCSSQDEDSDETESLDKKARGQEEVDKEEEDKEQCSPVSVLDPVEEEEDHHQRDPDNLNLLPCSFEVVQRKKRWLLKKLCRFEKLAGMSPLDLEGKMSEEQEEEYEESVEDDNMRVYDTGEEYEDVDEAMARESGWVEEERRKKKWRMMNAWRVGMRAEDAAEAVVQEDIRGEAREWTKHGGEVEEAVLEIELSIFIFLIDELSHELVSMNK